MNQFPSARRFATIPAPRSSRQKPAWLLALRRRDDRDDYFLSYPREKGKRENRERQSQDRTRYSGCGHCGIVVAVVAELMITICYARQPLAPGRRRSSRPRRGRLPDRCNLVMARSGAGP